MRRWVLLVAALEAPALVLLACDSFSGSDSNAGADASPEGSADDARVDTIDGSNPLTDASSGPLVCATFDAATSQPPSSLMNQVCNDAGGFNLSGDTDNCGWCGHACGPGSACTKGRCSPVAFYRGANYEVPFGIGPTSLYVARISPGAIFAVPLANGDGGATLLTGIPDAEPVLDWYYGATVGERLFMRTYQNLETAQLDGGPASVVRGETPSASFLLEQSGHLFESSNDTFYDLTKDGMQRKAVNDLGGAAEISVTPDGTYAFFIARSAVDGGYDAAVEAGVTRSSLYRYTLATQIAQEMLEFDAFGAYGGEAWLLGRSRLVASNDYVFFAEASRGDILRIPTTASPGVTPEVLSKGNGRTITSIAQDNTRIYWVEGTYTTSVIGIHAISRCGGGEFEYLSPTAAQPIYRASGLIAGPQDLFFSQDDTVYRLAK